MPEITVYISGQRRECTLADAFSSVYWAYLDALRYNQQTVPYDIQVIFTETGAIATFLLPDIIHACDIYLGWLGNFHYLLFTDVKLGSIMKKWVRIKLGKPKFNERLLAQAVKNANTVSL